MQFNAFSSDVFKYPFQMQLFRFVFLFVSAISKITFLITLKPSAQVSMEQLIERIKDMGGHIAHRYTIIPTLKVEFPSASFTTNFKDLEEIAEIEADSTRHILGVGLGQVV